MANKVLNITHAYCVELGRVVDIYEAHYEFFNRGELRRFHFMCEEDLCRKVNKTEVIGVNYDSPIYGKTKFFRRHPNSHHLNECKWAVENDLSHSKDRTKALTKVHQYELVDELVIQDSSKPSLQHGRPVINFTEKSGAATKSSGGGTNQKRQTTSLAKIVDIFDRLTSDERKQVKIKIGAQIQTFFRWFWGIGNYIDSKVTTPRVNYGRVVVRDLPQKKMFRIEFTKRVAAFNKNAVNLPAYTHISYASCKEEAGGIALERALKKAVELNKATACFNLGKAKLCKCEDNSEFFIEVLPISLKYIVLMDTNWVNQYN